MAVRITAEEFGQLLGHPDRAHLREPATAQLLEHQRRERERDAAMGKQATGTGKSAGRGHVNVAPADDRTWGKRKYPSWLEMHRAQALREMVLHGEILGFYEQPLAVFFGASDGEPIITYKPDFLVLPLAGRPWAEDAKGREFKDFRRFIVPLWKAQQAVDLHVLKWARKQWTVEIIAANAAEGKA